jgi:hypothetical protein
MPKRTDLRFFAALFCFASMGCGDDHVPATHRAPGERILPSGGTPSRPGSSSGGGSSGTSEPSTPDGGAPSPSEASTGGAGSGAGGEPTDDLSIGKELRIDVEVDVPTLVQLSTASVIHVDGDYQASADWDLAFQGWDLFTNGGASGVGKGGAFGPLPFTYFLAGTDPTDVPFLIEDKAAGAFRDWYVYDGKWHTLYSRFHAYGVRRGDRVFKVQLLGYYGEVQGAPISALFQLRYAEVTPGANGSIVVVKNLDATAGGLGGDANAPSTCLTLGTGEQQALTPKAALESSSWDLCFRRDSVSVNGGLGGPGGVTAVDLDAAETEGETLDAAKLLTPEGEAASFDAVDFKALTAPGLQYHGDRIVSAFTDAWVDRSEEPPTLPQDSTWLVVGTDAKSRYLLGFTGLKNSTAEAAGTVVMRIQQVR